MSYDYAKLFGKIIDATAAEKTITQRMLDVLEECSRQKPNSDWESFFRINFEADAQGIQRWFTAAFGPEDVDSGVRGLWFGLVNLSDGATTTADVYVGGSPNFDNANIDWASDILPVTERNYLSSEVLHQIYARAYREGAGALGNQAEYPLALAYGAIVALQALRNNGEYAPRLASLRGAAVGFDSGDFLFLGTVEQGHFYQSIKAG